MQTENRRASQAPTRVSVDLSGYPDLIVVYLGYRVSGLASLRALFGIGPKLSDIQRNQPDGLLAHETIVFGLRHIGMRQYWRDLDSLERFTKSDPHRTWWRDFLKDSKKAGFWHETYRRNGGMEAIYLDMPSPIGLGRFAASRAPTGPFMSARERLAA